MAAPKFNTGFVDIIDREVKEFTTRVEKAEKEKQARAEAISLDTANFLESLPENPTVELLDRSLKPAVESFLAQKRMNLAGLYRARRGDTVTYAPGTEAYNKITKEIEDGTRSINNVLNQLKTHQANKADYSQEQNSISQHWKEENLDMFADMKNIYLDKNYGTTIDAEGNITINGKYKINDWGSGENIKKLDWNVQEDQYSIIYSNVMLDAKNKNKTRKISKNDSQGLSVYTQLKNYFSQQTDGGKDAITSLIMDNPDVEGFNILQTEDNVDGLKNLIKQGKYNDAIESVARSNALRIIKEQNDEYDASNTPSGSTYNAGDQFDIMSFSGTFNDAQNFVNSSPNASQVKDLIVQTNIENARKYITGKELNSMVKDGDYQDNTLYSYNTDAKGNLEANAINLGPEALFDVYMEAYGAPDNIKAYYKNKLEFPKQKNNQSSENLLLQSNLTPDEQIKLGQYMENLSTSLKGVNRTGIPRTDEELYEEF